MGWYEVTKDMAVGVVTLVVLSMAWWRLLLADRHNRREERKAENEKKAEVRKRYWEAMRIVLDDSRADGLAEVRRVQALLEMEEISQHDVGWELKNKTQFTVERLLAVERGEQLTRIGNPKAMGWYSGREELYKEAKRMKKEWDDTQEEAQAIATELAIEHWKEARGEKDGGQER